jgi:hypothetical protein
MSKTSNTIEVVDSEDKEQRAQRNLYIPHGLPIEGNGDMRTHYSGIKLYDEDMEVAELMVQYCKHDGELDFLVKKQLMCFYTQRAYNYLDTVIKFYQEFRDGDSIQSMYGEEEESLDPGSSIVRNIRKSRMKEIFSQYAGVNRASYEQKRIAIAGFEKEQNLDKALYLFNYIMDCGLEEEATTKPISKRFVLPNIHGIYGICTYLYAYVNNVYLEAIPNKYAAYDNIKLESPNANPCLFYVHDYLHSSRLETERTQYGFYKENGLVKSKTLFYEILNNPKYAGTKEMLLLAYFDCLHELEIPIHKVPPEGGSEAIATEVNEAYEKFDSFFISDREPGVGATTLGWSDALKTIWSVSEHLQEEHMNAIFSQKKDTRESRGLPVTYRKYFFTGSPYLENSLLNLKVKRTSKDPKFTGYQLRHLCIMYFYEVLKEVLAAKFPPTDQDQKRRK